MRVSENSSVKSYNLSARGCRAVLWEYNGEYAEPDEEEVWVDDFPGDANPLTIDRISLGRVQRDVNGELYRSCHVPIFGVTVNLIPGSEGDLDWALKVCDYGYGEMSHDERTDNIALNTSRDIRFNLIVDYPSVNKRVVFVNGYLEEMSPGYSASGNGMVAVHEYRFAFSSCKWVGTQPPVEGV